MYNYKLEIYIILTYIYFFLKDHSETNIDKTYTLLAK